MLSPFPPFRRPLFFRAPARAQVASLARALALAAALGLPACSQRPVAAPFYTEPQYKVESAAHWALIAEDVASALSTYLETKVGKNAPVQLVMGRHRDSLFAETFQQDLITAFVRQGNPVAMQPRPEAVSILIDINAVSHGIKAPNHSMPGPFTALGGGVAVAHSIADLVPYGITAPLLTLAVGAGMDAYRSRIPETATELLLTISITQDGYFSYRSGAVYYIDDDELWQYTGRGTGGRTITLNDVPAGQIGIDLGGMPYVTDRGRAQLGLPGPLTGMPLPPLP